MIPKGQVLTYKEAACRAGKPQAARAVGQILKQNHNLQIPCHRVVAQNGKLGGYNLGIKKKILLLKKEGMEIKDGKVI
jgi:methylated-DNA-[protein]-cysteine S-methyltransferase